MGMKESFIELISAKYPLKKVENEEFASINLMGMDFITESYDAKGFGRFSWMVAEGMGGAMKMDTVVFNPFEIDMPLFSYDRIKAMGKDTFIVEMYNTMLGNFDGKDFAPIKAKIDDLEEMPMPLAHWYDAIRYPESAAKVATSDKAELLDEVVIEYLKKYLEIAEAKPACDAVAKKAKASEYSMGLVDQGGMAADNFVKAIGADKTKEFFKTLLFGA